MSSKSRTDAQRAAARLNGTRSSGPRTPEGRERSSLNRTVHGLNAVRLLLATEDVAEYRLHVQEWVESLVPSTAAERQVVLLLADLMWRLKRVARIEERRALAILDDHVERTPEWQTRARATELVVGLDAVTRMVSTSAVPVPTSTLDGFLTGVGGVVQFLDRLRDALPTELWPECEVCAFLAARDKLGKAVRVEVEVDVPFSDLGACAAGLAFAVRAVVPVLDAAVDKARTMIGTETLLVDDADRGYERHRRILEASMARQLDLLAKLRSMGVAASSSGSSERPPPVELRVIGT
jgi:hypothetical protein